MLLLSRIRVRADGSNEERFMYSLKVKLRAYVSGGPAMTVNSVSNGCMLSRSRVEEGNGADMGIATISLLLLSLIASAVSAILRMLV